MSYGIVRVQKFQAGSVKGIEIHDKRDKDHSHTNKEIDYERTKDNYSLHESEGTFRQNIKERIDQLDLQKAVRKDAVVMAQVLVTSDKEFFDKLTPEQSKEFFKQSYEFLQERYGKENVISATVHMDERTPHMHFNFVPVTEDGRLSAKTILNRTDLIKQHDDFYKQIGREWGLSRGEKDGYKTHLETAEFKKKTAYKEVEVIEKKLDVLKEIKTKVPLDAEKGKLMYDTKEVEAIKEQNRALKLESYEKGRKVDDLTHEVSRLQNRLSKVEKEIEGVKPHLERLKDLQSENRELQSYVEKRPDLQERLASFERQKKNAYDYGKAMVVQKDKYMTANVERRKSVEETHTFDSDIRKCDAFTDDLRHRQGQIKASEGKISDLEGQLEQTTGFFKGKNRKALQEQIDRERTSLKGQTDRLKTDYSVEPSAIDQKILSIKDMKGSLQHKRLQQDEYTHQQEQAMGKAVKDYKYYKAMSETQEPGFREISSRHDARVELPDYKTKSEFVIGRQDRAEILDRMEQQHPNNAVKCRENFDQQAQQEQAKVIEKTLSRSMDFGHER